MKSHSPLIEAAIHQDPTFSQEQYLRHLGVKPEQKHNVHLVLGGGGMKCTAIVGGLIALLEKFKMHSPAQITAGSGSVGTANYFIAGQLFEVAHIWSQLLSDKNFINKDPKQIGKTLLFWLMERVGGIDMSRASRMIDIRYLVHEVFKEQAPLMADNILASSIDYCMAATNLTTGGVSYFGNERGSENGRKQVLQDSEDVFAATMAAKVLPIVSGQAAKVQGIPHTDSCNSGGVEFHIVDAIARGATRVLALNVSDDSTRKTRIYRDWVDSKPPKFRERYRKDEAVGIDLRARHRSKFEHGGEFQEGGATVFLHQLRPSHVSTLTNNQAALQTAMLQGWQRTVDNRQLEAFMQTLP